MDRFLCKHIIQKYSEDSTREFEIPYSPPPPLGTPVTADPHCSFCRIWSRNLKPGVALAFECVLQVDGFIYTNMLYCVALRGVLAVQKHPGSHWL